MSGGNHLITGSHGGSHDFSTQTAAGSGDEPSPCHI